MIVHRCDFLMTLEEHSPCPCHDDDGCPICLSVSDNGFPIPTSHLIMAALSCLSVCLVCLSLSDNNCPVLSVCLMMSVLTVCPYTCKRLLQSPLIVSLSTPLQDICSGLIHSAQCGLSWLCSTRHPATLKARCYIIGCLACPFLEDCSISDPIFSQTND